jgi:hypothetical protein
VNPIQEKIKDPQMSTSVFIFLISTMMVFASYAFLNLDISESLVTSGLLVFQIWVGTNLVEIFWHKKLEFVQRLSSGLVVGVSILLTIDFLSDRIFNNHYFSLAVFLLFGFILGAITRPIKGSRDSYSSADLAQLLCVFGCTFAVFNFRALWAYPLSICFFILMNLVDPVVNPQTLQTRHNHKQMKVVLAGLLFALAIFLRQYKWTFAISNDAGFYESLSWSLIRYGTNEHPGFLGGFKEGPLEPYHTLSYSWAGLHSLFAGLEPYEFLNIIGPFVLALVITSSIASCFGSASIQMKASIWGTVLLSTVAIGVGNYNSLQFGLAVTFSLLSLYLDYETRPVRKRLFWGVIPLIFLGATAVYAKGTNLLFVVLILVSLAIVSIDQTRKRFPQVALGSLPIVIVGLLAWWKFIRIDSHVLSLSNSGYLFIDVYSEVGLVETFWQFRYQLFSLLQLFLFAILIFVRLKKFSQPLIRRISVLCFSTFAAYLMFFLTSPQHPVSAGFIFDMAFPLILACVFIAYLCGESVNSRKGLGRSVSTYGLVTVSGLGFVVLYRLFLLPNAEFVWNITSTLPGVGKFIWAIILEQQFLLLFSLAILTALVLSVVKPFRIIRIKPVFVVFIAFSISSLSFRADNITEFISSVSNRSLDEVYVNPGLINSAANPTSNLIALSEFVRESTTEDEVFASNNFCCFGEVWFEDILRNPSYLGESALGGANYLLPASLQRRFLIQGMRFQLFSDIESFPEHIRRMRLSLSYANAPSAGIKNQLSRYGVRWYVVNKSLTSNRNWDGLGTVRYENQDFLLIQLS